MPGLRPAGQAEQEQDSNKKSGGEGMEDETSRAGTTPVHRGLRCDLCGQKPITGTRYQSKARAPPARVPSVMCMSR